MTRYRLAITALLGLAVAAPVSAQTSYSSYASFAEGTSGQVLSTESFGTIPVGTIIPSGETLDGITFGFTLSGGANLGYIDNHGNSFSGNSLSRPTEAFQPGDVIDLTFSNPVNSFGIYVNTQPGYLYQLTANLATPITVSTTATTSYDTSTFDFLGVSSPTPFSSVTFTGGEGIVTQQNAAWGIPRFVDGVVPAVPEPSTYMAMLVGLAFVGFLSKRRGQESQGGQ